MTSARRHLAWIHEQPCCCCGYEGEVQAHHEPPKGMGGGGSTDYETAPLCLRCHMVRTGYRIVGHRYSKEDVKRAALAFIEQNKEREHE